MTRITSQIYRCPDGRELNVGRWWTEPVATSSGEYLMCGGNLPVEGKAGAGTDSCVAVDVDRCQVKSLPTTMNTWRQGVQPTCLTDGQCLLFGGNTTESSPSTTGFDILSVARKTVRRSSLRLPEPRLGYASARLPGDAVLIAGGYGVKDPATGRGPILNTAVLVNRTRKSTVVPMIARRGGHTITPLADGRYLLVGGVGDDPTGGELFDPKTRRFTAVVGKMKHGRKDHRAVLASDGNVYILGGTMGKEAPTAIERFEPGTGTFSETGLFLSQGREDLAVVYIKELNAIVAVGGEVKGAAGEPESQAIDLIELGNHRVHSAKLSVPRDEATLVVREANATTRIVKLLVLSGQQKQHGGEVSLPVEEVVVTLE